ncbi:MAG TPA: DNA-processing protein DprA [Phycisphaerae bacterium]|nr:DNA-processing protein DprA [Phycisphaerae bacterium]
MPENIAAVASSAAIEYLRWSMIPDVGPIRFARIVEAFGSPQEALGAGAGQLANIERIGPAIADQIAHQRDHVDVRGELELVARHGVRVICAEDAEFPPALRHIPDPPICLYIRGRLEPEDAVAIGVIGARRCTHYGLEQANRFGYQLASAGVTVVSGLARGVDSESHKGAIAAGGRTLAVLGNGLATIYPPEHAELADRIARQGAVLSELPMTTEPTASNFLPRNRLISGLSLGVLVIEAARRSGSLTTARLAAEYNREVFAVPGRVDNELARGTNRLIRDQHAKLVIDVEDILSELGDVGQVLGAGRPDAEEQAPSPAAAGLRDDERAVLDVLNTEAVSIESIARATGQPAARIAATLIGLQLRGLARQLPGNIFVRVGKR